MGADSGVLMARISGGGDKKECSVCGILFHTGYRKGTKSYDARSICMSSACRGVIAQRTRRASGIAGIAALSKEKKNGIAARVAAVKEQIDSEGSVPVFRVPRGASYEE